MLQKLIKHIQEGYTEGMYLNKKYGVSKTTFNNGKSIKLYGEELGGNDFVSLNYYITSSNEFLKPCEMPAQKVIHFLQNIVLVINEENGQN